MHLSETIKPGKLVVIFPRAACGVCLMFKIFSLPLEIFLSIQIRKTVYAIKNNGTVWKKKLWNRFLLFQVMALGIARSTEAFLPFLCLSHHWWCWRCSIFTSSTGGYPDMQQLAEHPLEKHLETRAVPVKAWWALSLFTPAFHLHIHISFLMSNRLHHKEPTGEHLHDWKKQPKRIGEVSLVPQRTFHMETSSPKAVRLKSNPDPDSYSVSSLPWANPAWLF